MDLDGDGKRDLIVPTNYNEFVKFRGLGDGRFADGVPLRVVGQPFADQEAVPAFSLADWNGDGRLDLFVGTTKSRVLVLLGSRDGFGPAETLVPRNMLTKFGSASVDAVDFDNDGDIDLVVTHAGGTAQLFENVGTAIAPKLGKPHVLVSADRKYEDSAFSVGDWHTDGRLDLLVVRWRLEREKSVPAVALTLEERAALSRARTQQAEVEERLWDLNRSRPDFKPGPLRKRRAARRELTTALVKIRWIVNNLELKQDGQSGKVHRIKEFAIYLRR